jgi:hypothetical protein
VVVVLIGRDRIQRWVQWGPRQVGRLFGKDAAPRAADGGAS